MSLSEHYRQGGELGARLLERLAATGRDIEALRPEDLAGADEFHLGGRLATAAILAELGLAGDERILDIGCGLGGPARHIAAETGCSVHGVDLTDEFVVVAGELSRRTGLDRLTSFETRDVAADGLPDGVVDVVTILHVGMNIPDKVVLCELIATRLPVGGRLVVYDIMRIGDGELAWPMPWSPGPETSFVESPESYRAAITGAGLDVIAEHDFRPLVRRAIEATATDPPPVDLSDLMGDGFATMFGNLRGALTAGVLAPTLLLARR